LPKATAPASSPAQMEAEQQVAKERILSTTSALLAEKDTEM